MVSTKVLPLKAAYESGFLTFPLNLEVDELRCDFSMHVEVFGLSFRQPGSKKDHKSLRLTPKKNKDKHLAAVVASPGSDQYDPTASSFGSLTLNIKNCRQKNFYLHNFITGSALAGSIEFQITLKATYDTRMKSFLNFYETKDDSLSWNRRWCKLDGNMLYIWRYSEDEDQNKPPIDKIDLRHCINPGIVSVPYETCARKFTFMLLLAIPNITMKAQFILNKHYKSKISK